MWDGRALALSLPAGAAGLLTASPSCQKHLPDSLSTASPCLWADSWTVSVLGTVPRLVCPASLPGGGLWLGVVGRGCWLTRYLCPCCQNQLSGYLLRKFKNSDGWQKLWVVFTNFCLFFYKTHQVCVPNRSQGTDGTQVFALPAVFSTDLKERVCMSPTPSGSLLGSPPSAPHLRRPRQGAASSRPASAA